MQNEYLHLHTIKIYQAAEGDHTIIFISHTEDALTKQMRDLGLKGALFCERLFLGQLPFVGYLPNPERKIQVPRECAKIHENVYMLPLLSSPLSDAMTESSLIVCNVLMWDLIKNEGIFDYDEDSHTEHNVYRVCIC